MAQSVAIDEKGRLLLPKKLRRAAGITTPAHAIVRVVGERRIELVAVDATMSRAKAIARKKFAGWREEAHEADRLAKQLAGRENP